MLILGRSGPALWGRPRPAWASPSRTLFARGKLILQLNFLLSSLLLFTFSGNMVRLHHIAKWICIFCYEEKGSVTLDWTVLPCDHLVCLRCFWQRGEQMKRMFRCPCGRHFPESMYDYILTFTATGHVEAERIVWHSRATFVTFDYFKYILTLKNPFVIGTKQKQKKQEKKHLSTMNVYIYF